MSLDFVGDDGGVINGLPAPLSMSRMNKQLRVLRGDCGVLGDNQPSVLTVLVGDNGGVMQPDLYEGVSSSVSFMLKSLLTKRKVELDDQACELHHMSDRLALGVFTRAEEE